MRRLNFNIKDDLLSIKSCNWYIKKIIRLRYAKCYVLSYGKRNETFGDISKKELESENGRTDNTMANSTEKKTKNDHKTLQCMHAERIEQYGPTTGNNLD